MIITTIILTVLLIISFYININLYKKNELLETQVDRTDSIESSALSLVENLLVTYIKVFNKLRRIDKLGGFQSDDEVGFVFTTIKNTIEELKNEMDRLKRILKNEENDTNGDD